MYGVFISSAWDNMASEKVHRAGNQKVWVLISVLLLTIY